MSEHAMPVTDAVRKPDGDAAEEGLVLSGVRKSFGASEVVRGVDLRVARGEFIVVLGPSGCGKSTLLRMIAGLDDASAGEIRIGGKVVTHLPPRKRGCAMVFQNYALYPHLNVAGNIGYPLKVAGVPKAERAERVAEAARIVNLSDYLDRKPSQLSGGQRQRVAMARAIVRNPALFLFDEPLSNLDAKLRVQMRAEIRDLHQRIGVTSLFVTHDQVEAMTLADRIVVMNSGRIEQVGTPTEIYHRPASRYVASFVGTHPMSFVEARISADGREAIVGEAGRIPLPGTVHSDRHGKRIVVGLRPEGVTVTDAGAGMLAASHVFSEELGSLTVLHCRMEGVSVLAQGPSGYRPASNAVGLTVAPEAVYLFDAETGQAVGTRD
ncbi:sn-glycerol-3-phosphate import ATP-binding protein UgpC [Hartmannibacter diazotrophicus]|uniref:sn-glycerol-3-phosphate import ATP-binding protein UgpC n=1 Tax=Hartmannibacter diazotrophicus TaxID=1482074 RepID=A0A2C9DCL1_9HYPH|nr:sn-glycerol-3-phosphate ABC transporter ATP-binding protein UgpC [Hartmannibacter diazotrophicus]SON58037.1 sn-glycerol-3-phosphate import ATP-binding protein UgpC [Hartmannibacter diazotrophicus]